MEYHPLAAHFLQLQQRARVLAGLADRLAAQSGDLIRANHEAAWHACGDRRRSKQR